MSRVALIAVALTILRLGTAVEDKPALDGEFLLKAAPHCHALIQYAELAENRAGNAEVKAFGQKLAKDLKKHKEDLTKAAEDQKLAVVSGTEKSTREELDRLSKLEGVQFDQAFLACVIKEFEKGIPMCEAQAEQGKDAKLGNFAKTSLPAMKETLKEAKALAEKVK